MIDLVLHGLYCGIMLSLELAAGFVLVKLVTGLFVFGLQFLHFDSGKADSRGPIDADFHGIMISAAILYAGGAFATDGPLAVTAFVGALTFAGILAYSFVRNSKKRRHDMWWLDYTMNCAFSLALGLPKLIGSSHPIAGAAVFYCGIRIISDYVRVGVFVRNGRKLRRNSNVIERVQEHYKDMILGLGAAQMVSCMVAPLAVCAVQSFASAVALYGIFRIKYEKRMPAEIELRGSLPEDVIFTFGALGGYLASLMASFCFLYGLVHPETENEYVVAYGRRICFGMGLGSLYYLRLHLLAGRHYADEPRMVEKASAPLHLAYAALSLANEFTQSLYKVRLFLAIALTGTLLLGYLVSDVARPDVKRPTPQEFLWSAAHCGLAAWIHLDLQYYNYSQIKPWTYPYVIDRLAPVLVAQSMANLIIPRIKPLKQGWKLGDWSSTSAFGTWTI